MVWCAAGLQLSAGFLPPGPCVLQRKAIALFLLFFIFVFYICFLTLPKTLRSKNTKIKNTKVKKHESEKDSTADPSPQEASSDANRPLSSVCARLPWAANAA